MARAITIVAVLAAGCSTTTDAPPPPSTTVAPPNPPPPTTVAPTTTTVPVPTTRAARGAPVAAETAVVASGDVWAALAACESGNRPGLRNPPYSGAFQFLRRTWQSLGYSGEAADHPYEVQREAAQRLQARSGWGQWPACSRKLGLR